MRRVIAIAAVASLVLLIVGVSSAGADGSAWWGLTSGAEPTNLRSGGARSEVQELTVGSEAAFKLSVLEGNVSNPAGLYATEPLAAAFSLPLASAANIQAGLESVYGAGNVEVSGAGPGGTSPFTITSIGEDVDRAVGHVGVFAAIGGASASVLTAGQPDGKIIVTAENRGNASTSGEVKVTDHLPEGLLATGIEAIAGGTGRFDGGPVKCVLKTLTCTYGGEAGETEALPPYEEIEVRISVAVKESAKDGEANTATVVGGGGSAVSAAHPVRIGGNDEFGFEDWQQIPENAGGSIDTQAGSHPFQLTNVITLKTQASDARGYPRPVALPKDIISELPAGLVGNPTPFVQCTDAQFSKGLTVERLSINECPAASAVGVATVSFNEPGAQGFDTVTAPIFNMTPRVGEPARLGFKALGIVSVFLDTKVRTGSDYGVTVTSSNITEAAWTLDVKLAFWGVPGDPAHDAQRGWNCLQNLGPCPAGEATAPPPFLVMPTSCATPFEATLRGDSWGSPEQPAEQAAPLAYRLPEAVDGCNHLSFTPTVKATPDGSAASTPTGLNVDVHVPQDAALNAQGLAESSVKDIQVTLPEGVALNPSGADGLQACSEDQIGFTGRDPVSGTDRFTPDRPEPFCPDASKVGTVRIKTPLLPNALEGAVYLAAQNANPFGSLVAMYLVAEDSVSGTLVKLPGEVSLNQTTGQITGTFEHNPQLPFEDAELHFFGGERAPLATPAHCGTYTTRASFEPWSGNEPVSSQSNFAIVSGPNGSSCPDVALPFAPALTGGTVNNQAGSFSAFTMTMSREDGQQSLKSIQLHMPPGLSGVLTGIPLCGEAEADAGTCSTASLLGETTVSVGLGGSPYSVKGGQVFLTGPYKGAPFGLSIVNPAVAGPFNLGKVIVRAKLEVDPHTAAVTVTSDDSGPYAIPPSIDGIPLQIKHVNVTINRPGFTFNPTNCTPTAVTGNLQSIEGGSSSLSAPFQATNCAVLQFAPKFAVTTTGKNSKANGAALSVKLTYPKAPFGSQANVKQVKVELPKQLPSRLTTLQKACTSAQFEANPAGCPAASIIGHARATTPLIPVPLEGPAYFVSHGGEAFPSLVMVLSGYGVRLDLVGTTFISKTGITSSTFKTVPDAPVGSFELTLPQGPYSALTALGNLCTSKLSMPSEFVAQNGMVLHRSTPVGVTGCPKKKALTRVQKLDIALKACHKDHGKAKRQKCERAARNRFAPVKAKQRGGKK
jgi:hypothetical protein